MVLEQSIGLFHIVQKCPLADFEALELWNVLSELEKSELQLLEVIFVNACCDLGLASWTFRVSYGEHKIPGRVCLPSFNLSYLILMFPPSLQDVFAD